MWLFGLQPGHVEAFLLVFTRIGGIAFTAPILSSPRVPPQLKAGLSLLLAVLLCPLALRHGVPAGDTLPGFFLLLIQEAVVGLVIGYAANLLFSVVQMAGEMQDTQSGFGFAGVVDPNMGQQSAILGQFQMIAAWLLFFALNGHLWLMQGIAESFLAIPLGGLAYNPSLPPYMFSLATALIMSAIKIGAPVIGAMLLSDLALGMLQRTAPQLNLIAIGFQVKIAVALAVLLLALPLLLALQGDLLPFIRNVMHDVMELSR